MCYSENESVSQNSLTLGENSKLWWQMAHTVLKSVLYWKDKRTTDAKLIYDDPSSLSCLYSVHHQLIIKNKTSVTALYCSFNPTGFTKVWSKFDATTMALFVNWFNAMCSWRYLSTAYFNMGCECTVLVCQTYGELQLVWYGLWIYLVVL